MYYIFLVSDNFAIISLIIYDLIILEGCGLCKLMMFFSSLENFRLDPPVFPF